MKQQLRYSKPCPMTVYVCLVTLILIISSASSSLCQPGKILLRLHGSNTIGAKLGPDLAKRFFHSRGYRDIIQENGSKENEYFINASKDGEIHTIEIQAHGSSTSFKSLESNLCDVGMASRRIKDKEVEILKFLGDMTSITNEHVLAIDGIAVIVHRENPLETLDVETISKIFSGSITNWKEVGGFDKKITLYARDDNSGTYDTFKSIVLDKTPLIGNARRYESNAALADDVSVDPAAIGFVGMPYVRNAKALSVKKNEDSIGILPTNFTAAYEEYPISRRLYLYTATEPANRMAKEFVDFALSYEGQKSVAILGFAKLSLDMEERNLNLDRFQNHVQKDIYAQETRGGRRINFNFRFSAGNSSLENRSQKDLERFINYIRQPDQRYYEPLLIGINSCHQAEKINAAIVNAIGLEQFHVPPKTLCLDYATNSSGRPLESLVEVWLRVVNDGA